MVINSDMVTTGAGKSLPLRPSFLKQTRQNHMAYVQPQDRWREVTPKLHLQLPAVALNLAPLLLPYRSNRTPPGDRDKGNFAWPTLPAYRAYCIPYICTSATDRDNKGQSSPLTIGAQFPNLTLVHHTAQQDFRETEGND
jgi:hypothetical protein